MKREMQQETKRMEEKPVHDGRTLDTHYLPPQAALHKLARAKSKKEAVYLHGVMGSGKTALMTYFLKDTPFAYYSAVRTAAADLAAPAGAAAVVIDDLEVLSEERREGYYLAAERLIRQKDVWLVLISRSAVPRWLTPLYVYYPFVEIGEKDLVFSEERQREYLARQGIVISPSENAHLRSLIMGNPLALRLAARIILEDVAEDGGAERGKLINQSMIDRLENAFGELMAHWACRWWPDDLMAFLMKLSVADDFTLPMAQIISESDQAEAYLLACQEYGGFMRTFRRYREMRYQIYEPFRQFLKKQLKQKNTTAAVTAVYRRASSSYERVGDLIKAIEMAEQSGNDALVLDLLVANAARSLRLRDFWQLRRHYRALPATTVRAHAALMAAMSVVEALAFHDEASEAWVQALQQASRTAAPQERQLARERLVFLSIALPHRSNARMVESFLKWKAMADRKPRSEGQAVLGRISLCGETPSILNGLKDFCDWICRPSGGGQAATPDVARWFGQFGKGVQLLAEGEARFECGDSSRQTALAIQRGLLLSEAESNLPYVLVAMTLMAQQYVLDNAMEEALDLVEGWLDRVVDEAPELTAITEALAVRLMLYQGGHPRIERWMRREARVHTAFSGLSAFSEVTKARVYLQQGREKKAQNLLQRLLAFARRRHRTYLTIEVTLLAAITAYRLGECDWKSLLQAALAEAEKYHLVRLLTREGLALVPMLRKGRLTWHNPAFKKQVMAECRAMAAAYPHYLNAEGPRQAHFSAMALTILKAQAEGKTARQIAESVGLSEAGVKYYNKETYRKLGVHNKTEAVIAAKSRKLI